MNMTSYTALCNRCNAGRPWDEHPCPACGCPEYRLPPGAMAREVARARAVKSLAPEKPRAPLPRQMDLFGGAAG